MEVGQTETGENTKTMKIRLLLIGCILIILGGILMTAKGFAKSLLGLSLVGAVILVLGFLWI